VLSPNSRFCCPTPFFFSLPGAVVTSAWSVVLREHATHDIFVDVDAEDMRNLLRDAYTAELGIAALKLHDRRDEFHRRAFRTGFAAMRRGGKEQAVFSID